MSKQVPAALVAAGIAALLSTGAARANTWPKSVVGSWSAFANQSPLVLNITSQGTLGNCPAITGTLADTVNGGQTSNIQGFYCPHSGRIQFLRQNQTTNDTFQTYVGNVSMTGPTLYIGGTFAEDSLAGALGEYNFWAQK